MHIGRVHQSLRTILVEAIHILYLRYLGVLKVGYGHFGLGVLQVSSAFGTPVGGVLFSLEEVRSRNSQAPGLGKRMQNRSICGVKDGVFRRVLNLRMQRRLVKMNAFHFFSRSSPG